MSETFATYHPAEALRPGDLWLDDGFWRVLEHIGGRTYRLLNEKTGEVVSTSFPNIACPTDPPSPPVAQLIDANRTGRAHCSPDAGLYALKAANELSMGPEDTHAIIVEVQRWIDESNLPLEHPDAVYWSGGIGQVSELLGEFEALLHELKTRLFRNHLDPRGQPLSRLLDFEVNTEASVSGRTCVLRPWYPTPSPSAQRSN